jgi:hypothetical protein
MSEPKTAILAGPGPSAKSVVWSRLPDAPVAAVNSALLYCPKPRWLIFCDRPQILVRAVGQRFVQALADPGVEIIQPSSRRRARMPHTTGCRYIERLQGKSPDRHALEIGRHQLDGKEPVFWATGMTTMFAVEFLVLVGIRRIIFAGHDLDFDGRTPHADGLEMDNSSAHRSRAALEKVYGVLQAWAPLAKREGIELYYHGTSRLSDFLPLWDGEHTCSKP